MCLGPGPFPYVEIIACAAHVALSGNLFPVSGLDVHFFVLLKVCAYGTPLLYQLLAGRKGGSSPVAHVCLVETCVSYGARHTGPVGRKLTIEVDLTLSLLRVSKVLFPPVTGGVVSFLATLTHAHHAVGCHPGIAAPCDGILNAMGLCPWRYKEVLLT